jgi:hypothetical protein
MTVDCNPVATFGNRFIHLMRTGEIPADVAVTVVIDILALTIAKGADDWDNACKVTDAMIGTLEERVRANWEAR